MHIQQSTVALHQGFSFNLQKYHNHNAIVHLDTVQLPTHKIGLSGQQDYG